ncbi:MAG: hypothetical protein QM756_06635 [Polyangiaceae bacterium]
MWDVTSGYSAVVGQGAAGVVVFSDLQSGRNYGATVAYASGVGSVLVVDLDVAAIADINASLGSSFIVGLHIDTLSGARVAGGEAVRFAELGEPRRLQLELTLF